MPAVAHLSLAPRPLRIGFVPLTDAAPLVVAQERGLFASRGLDVQLSREVGWATLRDKVIFGDLDAAHAPAGMVFSTRLGLGCPPTDVAAPFVFNLHGNALTLSRALREEGAGGADGLRAAARRRRGERRLTFGVVFAYSSHHVMLRAWLRGSGLDPDRDVRVVVVPPAQMVRNLAAGTIDGFCAGEPWNTAAVQAGVGWCPIHSAASLPGHVEKVLLARTAFAAGGESRYAALADALEEACAWADEPANRAGVARLLSAPRYLNLPERVLLPTLVGRFDDGAGTVHPVPDFLVFHARGANEPTLARERATLESLVSSGLVGAEAARTLRPGSVFRRDLYHHARQLRGRPHHETETVLAP